MSDRVHSSNKRKRLHDSDFENPHEEKRCYLDEIAVQSAVVVQRNACLAGRFGRRRQPWKAELGNYPLLNSVVGQSIWQLLSHRPGISSRRHSDKVSLGRNDGPQVAASAVKRLTGCGTPPWRYHQTVQDVRRFSL